MSEKLEDSIVLITSSDSTSQRHTIGTGFVIHQDKSGTYLLTCTHVVKDRNGEKRVITANDNIPAKIVYCDEKNGFDLAVLHVDATLNKPSLKLSIVGRKGSSFKTQGFSLFGTNKNPLIKQLQGILDQSVTMFSSKLGNAGAWELSLNAHNHLKDGFSGAPVIDEKSGYVLGVVSHLLGDGSRGLAISIESLEKIWLEMPPGLIIHKPSIDPRPPRRVADYTKLENLLQAGRWEEADRETWAVMLKAADLEREGSLSTTSIKIFPCTDLCTINHLWEKYSKRRFGFSIQKLIWEFTKGQQPGNSDQEVYKKFGQLVGWMVKEERLPDVEKEEEWLINPDYNICIDTPQQYEKWLQYSEHTFTLDAPRGHLPRVVGDLGREALVQLFYRIKTCSVDCNI